MVKSSFGFKLQQCEIMCQNTILFSLYAKGSFSKKNKKIKNKKNEQYILPNIIMNQFLYLCFLQIRLKNLS